MRTPDQVRDKLRTRWERQWPGWLGDGGSWPLRLALDAPVERAARADWPRFQAWIATWAASPLPGRVVLQDVRWPALGAQTVPTHVEFDRPGDVAATLGRTYADQFAVADRRFRELSARWPDLVDALRRLAPVLAYLTDDDYARLVDAVAWLSSHRNSGLFVRQLPIAGLDSKWIETHASAVGVLLAARFGQPPGTPLAALAGLAQDPPRRRLRFLDPELRRQFGGLSDISLPLPDLVALAIRPRATLIVENQQTALACGDLPGTLLIMGGGFSAPELASAPWLHECPVFYWGDIDTAGFAILNALRQRLPHVESLLMDEATMDLHRGLSITEPIQVSADLLYLSTPEATLYRDLLGARWGSSRRLEQERLPWEWAWAAVATAISA